VKYLLVSLAFLAATSSGAQETVYVAPAPQPGDPAYISYRLDQLAEVLRRNEIASARLEVFKNQAAINQKLLDRIDLEELESLVSLATVLEAAGTEDQRQALSQVISSRLEAMLPASLRTYPPGTSLVVAAPGFPWAAEQVAGVLGGKPVAIEESMNAGGGPEKLAREMVGALFKKVRGKTCS
jgi:hypothetical protein